MEESVAYDITNQQIANHYQSE